MLIPVEVLQRALCGSFPLVLRQGNAVNVGIGLGSGAALYLDYFCAFSSLEHVVPVSGDVLGGQARFFVISGGERWPYNVHFFSNTRSSVLPFHPSPKLSMAANREACNTVQLNQN